MSDIARLYTSPALAGTDATYPPAPEIRLSIMTDAPPTDLPDALRASWNGFQNVYEPLRSDLYRYCRHLTRSAFDAEDLAQDTMARAFVTLAQMGAPPPHPRAWLFRVAHNLWIDQLRKRGALPAPDAPPPSDDPRATREAAATLIAQLAPQERAAVVLKDVFAFSLEEIAESLSTTVGAVKAALHRGRGKLVEPEPIEVRPPAPGVVDAFCEAFHARDLDRLTALLLESATVEVVGATTQYGPEDARRTVLWGMLFGAERLADAARLGGIEARFVQRALPTAPRVEVRAYRGRPIVVHWYAHEDGEAVRAITTIEPEGDRIAHLASYFFSPDLLAEVCTELGLPYRVNGHRWWLTGCP